MAEEVLLVGDIGGTNTRLTLYSFSDPVTANLSQKADAARLAATVAAAAQQRCVALTTTGSVEQYTPQQFDSIAMLQGQEAAEDTPCTGSIILQRKYKNEDASGLDVLIEQFLHEAQLANPPVSACLAVAGTSKL